jgi:alpha-1,2-mannosyltransferase
VPGADTSTPTDAVAAASAAREQDVDEKGAGERGADGAAQEQSADEQALRAIVNLLSIVLWLLALGGTAYLAERRYKAASLHRGHDFLTFLHAAQAVAAGRDPYSIAHYVYPPTIALVLAPFVHASWLWKLWCAVSVIALSGAIAAVVASWIGRLATWQYPIVFGFGALTAFHSPAMTQEAFLGQTDTMALLFVALALVLSERGRGIVAGVALGIAALIKSWPVAIGLWFLRHGGRQRMRSLVALVVTALVAIPMAAGVAGWHGVTSLFSSTFNARSQPHNLSQSVWGVPQLLFAHSVLTHPVVVSLPLQVVVEVLLAVVVAALLVLALVVPGDSVLSFWNVTLAVLLLLPVSHPWYLLYALPLLWCWGAQFLTWRRPVTDGAVLAVLVAWLLVSDTSLFNPAPGSSAARFAALFVANLIVLLVSTIGAASLEPRPLRTALGRLRLGPPSVPQESIAADDVVAAPRAMGKVLSDPAVPPPPPST